MTVKRLRPLPSAEGLAAMYPTPHDHRIYGRGHHERVEATIALARPFVDRDTVVVDLSCGNGEIANRLCDHPILGDIAPGYPLHGPIEQTIGVFGDVAMFICSETLEHVDDPPAVLAAIRNVARRLTLSTPLECWDDTNAEHLWAWDRDGVEDLFYNVGWAVEAFDSVDSRAWGEPYLYGIWVCS